MAKPDPELQALFDLEPKGTKVDQMDWDRAVEVPETTLDKFRATDKNGRDITTRNYGIRISQETDGLMLVRTREGKPYIGPKLNGKEEE